MRLLVDDEPFDVRYGTLDAHRRSLDLRAGTLDRQVEWRSPAGDGVRVHTTRLVSLTQRAVAALCYEVEPIDSRCGWCCSPSWSPTRSCRRGRRSAPRRCSNGPSTARSTASGHRGGDGARTHHSGLRVASGMRHVIDGPENTHLDISSSPDICRLTVATRLAAGQRLRIVKFLAYGWSSQRTRPALHDQVVAALAAARLTGWEGLLAEQRLPRRLLGRGRRRVGGDAEVQQAVRFGLFHILQAGAGRAAPDPRQGVDRTGYDGHTFWDTETFVLPVLTYTKPEAAASALAWRKLTMPVAQERAAELRLEGAAFPWRTIRGRESSGYWPAGTAAFHINADIAGAVVRYVDATEDREFEHDIGVDLLVGTARLWRSLGHHNHDGHFRIDGVTGPDEYSAIADNNVFTNLMAQQNLRAAAAVAGRHADRAAELGVSTEEAASWRGAADAILIPYDELGVHPRARGSRTTPCGTSPPPAPSATRSCCTSTTSTCTASRWSSSPTWCSPCTCGATPSPPRRRTATSAEALTVRDSSLSACTQAVMAAELGYLELAYDYLAEAALMDLEDRNQNTGDGLHMASLAGAWTALVEGSGACAPRRSPRVLPACRATWGA